MSAGQVLPFPPRVFINRSIFNDDASNLRPREPQTTTAKHAGMFHLYTKKWQGIVNGLSRKRADPFIMETLAELLGPSHHKISFRKKNLFYLGWSNIHIFIQPSSNVLKCFSYLSQVCHISEDWHSNSTSNPKVGFFLTTIKKEHLSLWFFLPLFCPKLQSTHVKVWK